ncbi:MAG TPA: hypothetical protein VJ603_06120 [Paucimonas sp.]|nr:hypothetical protein [Paucimonas sp.]
MKLCGALGLINPRLAGEVADAYRLFRERQHQIWLQGADQARLEPQRVAHEAGQVRQLLSAIFDYGRRFYTPPCIFKRLRIHCEYGTIFTYTPRTFVELPWFACVWVDYSSFHHFRGVQREYRDALCIASCINPRDRHATSDTGG